MSTRPPAPWKPAGPAPSLDQAYKQAGGRLASVLATGNRYYGEKAASTGAIVPPEEVYKDRPDEYSTFLDKCVELHNFLLANKVPKSIECGQVVEGRPKRGAEPPIECSADGYKMVVDMAAYSEKMFTQADVNGIEGQQRLLASGQVSGIDALAAHGWATIQGTTFEERVKYVQSLPRAAELLSPYTDLCKYGDDQQILVNLFEDVSKKKTERNIQPRNPAEISPDGFTREIMSTAEFVLFHPSQNGFVWIHRVVSAQQAAQLHLPWPPPFGETEYIYLPLICATDDFAGGGAILMNQVAKAMAVMKIRTLVFSALPHVVWYYYKSMSARFLNMNFVMVDVAAYNQKPLIQPYSRAEADVKLASFGGRPKRR